MNVQTSVIKTPIMATKPAPEPVTETPVEEKKPEPVKQTIQAQYKFSPDEQIALGKQLVAAMRNQDQIASEFDTIKKQFKYREDQAQLDTDVLRSKLQDGFEMRPTLARIEFNKPTQGRKTYLNDTNGEYIRDEQMTAADMQPPLIQETEEATEEMTEAE